MVGALDFAAKATILVVDDGADNLEVISGLLKDLYKIKVANNGEKALQIALGGSPPDLILLDIMMPELSGYDVCIRLKQNAATRDIPILFLTALTAAEDETKGLGLGAEDYITKPVNPSILRARVKTHLRIKGVIDFLRERAAYLERELVQRSTSELDFTESVRQIAREFKAASERFGK
jgi:putative two-component system response regulator